MAVARLPSILRVPEFDSAEANLIEELVLQGLSIGTALMGALPPDELWRSRAVVFRKWAFDCLFYLSGGPLGFNQLSLQMGRLRGESLSVRLESLVNHGILERKVLSQAPFRVQYRLSKWGDKIAVTAFVLSLSHTEQVRAAVDPEHAPVKITMEAPGRLDRSVIPEALDGYVQLARRFAAGRRRQSQGYPDMEDSLATARRFAVMCVRRWEAEILLGLLTGPKSFGQIRSITGAGNEALAKSLRHLVELDGATKSPEKTYAIAPFGVAKLALGAPVVALAYDATHP